MGIVLFALVVKTRMYACTFAICNLLFRPLLLYAFVKVSACVLLSLYFNLLPAFFRSLCLDVHACMGLDPSLPRNAAIDPYTFY